jgi:hypothetical protein
MTRTITENGLGPALKVPPQIYCAISGMAVIAELIIYLAWASDLFVSDPNFPLWCWLITLDVGFTCGIFGLCWARSWRGRLLGFILLCVHSFLLIILFFIALQNKVMPGLH